MSTDIFNRSIKEYLTEEHIQAWKSHHTEWRETRQAKAEADKAQQAEENRLSEVTLKRENHALEPYFKLMRLGTDERPLSLFPVHRNIWPDLARPFSVYRSKGDYGAGRYTHLCWSLWKAQYWLGDNHGYDYISDKRLGFTVQSIAKEIGCPDHKRSKPAERLEGYIILPEDTLRRCVSKPREIEKTSAHGKQLTVEPVLDLYGHLPFIRTFWDEDKQRHVWGVLFTEVVEWWQSTPTKIRDWSWLTNNCDNALNIALELATQNPDLEKRERYTIPGGRTRNRGGISLAGIFAQINYM